MKPTLLLLALILTACSVDPTPTAAPEVYPIEPDYETIELILTDIAPTATPGVCEWGLQAWDRYPTIPARQAQEITAAVDDCSVPVAGMVVEICVLDDCQTGHTGLDGQISSLSFEMDWDPGVVPFTVCIVGEDVCLAGAFLVVEDGE